MAATTAKVAAPPAEASLVDQYLVEARRIEELRRSRKKLRNVEGYPFWPHEAVRSTIIVLYFSASLLFLSALMPYFLEKPANPAGQPEVILPDWYLLWSYGLLKPGVANPVTFNEEPIAVPVLYQLEQALGHLGDPTRGVLSAKTIGIVLNMVIILPLVAAPFVSTGHPRRPQEAPWTAAFGVAGIVYVFNVSVYSINNVILTKIGWWGDHLLKLTPGMAKAVTGAATPAAAAKAAGAVSTLWSLGFWVLPLPVASFLVRTRLLKEAPKSAALVSVVELVLLTTIVGYGAGLDVVLLARNPLGFWAAALAGTSLLSWVVWWSTLLSFEVAYWSLRYWKLWAMRQDHYEHGLNLTYFKVR
jgi:hypothetical protein